MGGERQGEMGGRASLRLETANFGRSWATPRLLKAAIHSGEVPAEGSLWLADLEEAKRTDLQGSSKAVFAGEDNIGLKVTRATLQPHLNSQGLPSCSLRLIYCR